MAERRERVKKNDPFEIAGVRIKPGEHAVANIPVTRLHTHTPIDLTVHVFQGRRVGPCLFVSAALHGDELNGVEICRRLMRERALRGLRGTLLVVPVVNVLGFLHHSRYFPDHRDLNRSFPGLANGSLAARTAELFMRQIVARCTHGIDLHAGTRQRFNLPQTRGKAGSVVVEEMARAFHAPVHLYTDFLDGSLRGAAHAVGVPVLLYEGGEAMRFDEVAIQVGLKGILGVMRHLGMLAEGSKSTPIWSKWWTAHSSRWVRAPESGMMWAIKRAGSHVRKGEVLGHIANPLGSEMIEVRAEREGVIIGHTNHPLVNQGDALFHVAFVPDAEALQEMVQETLGVALHEGLNDEFM
ncbi:MAG: succinylglutamate desuccinylase/aspartoacylase family protein [Magnetococcales bacterium]|nr:succinylglutamate desuccinylase/aspartoacylase family protein [Magnetococcales bacterium]